MLSARYIVLAVLAVGFVSRTPAQSNPCLSRTIPAHVYTKRGEVVKTLKAANFRASVRGKPIVVTDATYNRGPRRIVILIDVSGSMTERGKLNFGLVFARDLISLASPQTSLALMTFTDRIEDVVPFDRDRATLLAEIDKLQNTNWARLKGTRRTALEGSLLSALGLLRKPGLGDAICVVTDGGEDASHSRKFKVNALLESAGVRVYTFLTAWYSNPRAAASVVAEARSELQDLAATTGGAFVVFVPVQVRNNAWPVGPPVPILDGDRKYLLGAAQVFYGEISASSSLT